MMDNLSSVKNPPDALPGLLIVGNHLSASTMTRTVSEDLAVRLEEAGFPTICTSRQQRPLLRLVDMLLTTAVGRGRYQVALIDVFSGRAFRYAETVSALLRFLRCPFILTLHGGDLPSLAEAQPGRVRGLFDRAAAITCPSSYLAENLSGFAPIEVIANPIDCSRFLPGGAAGVPQRIVWLRAFHSIYRPWDAIQALALVVQRHPEAHLRMIGPDKGDGSLKRVKDEIARHQLQSNVDLEIPGLPHANVPEALSRSDLFLNTTAVDNTPVSVLEAMASGLPVVSTNAGGLPYFLHQNRTALLTDVGAIDELATAMCRLIEDPVLYGTLRANGLGQAKASDWDSVLPLWCELIQRVAAAD